MERADVESALQELHPASFGWALSCCHRDREEAEEVLQMSYLKIIEGKARFDGRSSFKTWLFAVIRYTALERFRWQRVRQMLFVETASPPRPDQILERSERTQQLIRALLKISTRQREVLDLVFYHDMTIEEASQTLGISLGSARVHYERGKRRLLAILNEEERVAFA
ncbi:MAG TPA: RNA polymerase sigma factor [Thermoanaerobaculia bacterium]|jgi:RNA polymerase sigma-70 factor (ECF subfamily)